MKRYNKGTIILGGGITGLTAGYNNGFPIFEAEDFPGGICASYYIKPGEKTRHMHLPNTAEAYRFETGGGHWIFGADVEVFRFIHKFTEVKKYIRRSSVYFSKNKQIVPYPIQRNVKFLGKGTGDKILKDLQKVRQGSIVTMKEWMTQSFGPTLCNLFFYPFHELYTAGLYEKIAPQDQYKSPARILSKSHGGNKETGYNATFIYPNYGLDVLVRALASRCDIRYKKRVIKIDMKDKEVYFSDNSSIEYKHIISTLPLNEIVRIAGLDVQGKPDPYTSVLVLNIGGARGESCPDEHWLYVPDSKAGFYRVGFYSNVDASFLPVSSRRSNDRVSIYVECAFRGGQAPTKQAIKIYSNSVIKELQDWGFIKDAEAIDSNWIDVAYTWTYPGSTWRDAALRLLRESNIHQIGRYGRWRFQGIAESIKEGINIIKNG